MNTLDELLYYCEETEPIGALLLTGEWGCGKTYLIDNKLKKALGDAAHVIRISLFGISSIEGIHFSVRQAWISESVKNKKFSEVAKKAQQGKEIVAKLEFLPEWARGIATTDWQSFIDIKSTIDEKPVILVFDDLERSCLDYVDVLGAVNDYCENQKFHTIIIANQDKMSEIQNVIPIEAEIESGDQRNKKTLLKIKAQSLKSLNQLSYAEIKEKIIHRTVKYVPEYSEIVHTVIEEMKYEDDAYRAFVKECEQGLLDLFAPDRDIYDKSQKNERPHNIRSLKCAIKDFYRVYNILTGNEFKDIDKWFYSFSAYVIAYKANIAKEEDIGTLFSDKEVRKLYPAFQDQYMLEPIKKWILHGIWNEDDVIYELQNVKEREKAKTPTDFVRTYRIIDVEEDIINKGFPDVINMAYEGTLTLDEYVLLIQNCCWARQCNFELPLPVDWSKVQEGIGKSIKHLIDLRNEGQQLYSIISSDNKACFTKEEWDTYQIIDEFKNGNILMFSNNKKLYIEQMKTDAFSAFVICQNKRFDRFDEEMAVVTAEAYDKGQNSDKHQFPGYFKEIWKSNIMTHEMKIEESLVGFHKLKDLLEKQKVEFEKNGKMFAICHTKDFIKCVDELIKEMEEDK